MTIDNIYKAGKLSVRSFNVCMFNELETLDDLQEFYTKHKSFVRLRNCGEKSNKELIKLCNDYAHNRLSFDLPVYNDRFIVNCLDDMPRIKRDVINSFILINTNSLSVRSRNAICSYLEDNLKVKNFLDKVLLSEGFEIRKLKNVGSKCIPELEIYISIIDDFIKQVLNIESEPELHSLKNRFLLANTYSISHIPQEILESESIFTMVHFLINNNALYDNSQKVIFERGIRIYHNNPDLTLDEIASKVGLTRERVRQLRKICIDNLWEKLKFVKNFSDDLFQKYGIDTKADYITLNDEITQRINNNNQTNFTKDFITYIIAVYLDPDFICVGNVEDVLLPKFFTSRDRHNWQSLYLVKSEISQKINLYSLVNDINMRIGARTDESYSFNFKSYLSKFTKTDLDVFEATEIAEKIINEEFDLYLDLEENICFKRNTVKQVPEYAVEALEKIGKPSKIEDIYMEIKREFPEVTKSQEALRGSLQRSSEIIYFGRSSTYGLKKWEFEKDNIKGGTIKDIILSYLMDKSTPIHVYEILEEVHKYRNDTNAKNIITNLKLDPQRQFVIFNQSFIGIKGKAYNSNLTDLPKFLGKSITNYAKQRKCKDPEQIIEYFSNILAISDDNMSYILRQLIDNKFIMFNNYKN